MSCRMRHRLYQARQNLFVEEHVSASSSTHRSTSFRCTVFVPPQSGMVMTIGGGGSRGLLSGVQAVRNSTCALQSGDMLRIGICERGAAEYMRLGSGR